nr:MAG TPA: hypothetical protein [Caudoviricetes sp.]
MDKEREVLMLINCLRKSAESLKESGTWVRGLDDSKQCETLKYFTLKSTATAEAALAEAYKIVSMINSDKACKTLRELDEEDNNADTEIHAQAGGNSRY